MRRRQTYFDLPELARSRRAIMASIACRSSSDTAWLGGVDGYSGGVFCNETTSALNYGYVHLVTP